MFSLDSKKILLVGATSDIGQAAAIECMKADAELVLTGRTPMALELTTRKIQELQPIRTMQSYQCDLTDSSSIETLAEILPSVDGVVVSVGTLETLPCKLHTSESVMRSMDVNFKGTVLLISALLRKKKVNKGASIVFISSVAGVLLAEKGNALYGASKAALSAYSKVLALELASRKIRVNCIMPGMVRTKFLNNFALDEEDFKSDEQKYPLGYGTPEDVAGGVVYLLSDAARWITGTDLLMDGGRTLQ